MASRTQTAAVATESTFGPLTTRPSLGSGESVLSLVARTHRLFSPVERSALEANYGMGLDFANCRRLLVGADDDLAPVARALGTTVVPLSAGTIAHLGTARDLQQRWNKREPTLRLPVGSEGIRRPVLLHLDGVPFCPDCLLEQPDVIHASWHNGMMPLCRSHGAILALRCPSCDKSGLTVRGQVANPGHCVYCNADLRRARRVAARHVDGLEEAVDGLDALLGAPALGDASQRLASTADFIVSGLITDHAGLTAPQTSRVRTAVREARHRHTTGGRVAVSIANRPDPVLVASYLPNAWALTSQEPTNGGSWPDSGRALFPLATLAGERQRARIAPYIDCRMDRRLYDQRRRLPRLLTTSLPDASFLPPASGSSLKRQGLPDLVPLDLFDEHLADLLEPVLADDPWPSVTAVRAALAHWLAGRTEWQGRGRPRFLAEYPERYPHEHLLHAVQLRLAAYTDLSDLTWLRGVSQVQKQLLASRTDWQRRGALVRDDAWRRQVLQVADVDDAAEAVRWLHEVWACTVDTANGGTVGAGYWLLAKSGEVDSQACDRLAAAAAAVRAGIKQTRSA